jgi:hypothetical protein
MAERKSFLLRIDAGLWSELEAWAQDELRSVNGQIEYLLRDAVQKRRGRALVDAEVGDVESSAADTKRKSPRRRQ